MARRLAIMMIALLVLVPVTAAYAGGARFGDQESFTRLTDVALKGPKGEALILAYMTKTTYFIAGISLEDEGYVLLIKDEGRKYYDMPPPEKVLEYQKAGLLPDPLPAYHLGWFDYFLGYSLFTFVVPLILLLMYWGRPSPGADKAKAAGETKPAAGP